MSTNRIWNKRDVGGAWIRRTLCSLIFLIVAASSSISQESEFSPRSVPAEFLRDLLPQDGAERILRPTDIHVDEGSGEIFVSESGGNRVLIFNADGLLRYQFSCAGSMSHPVCLDVDSEGFIYILGPRAEGREIFRFDYDGLPMGTLPLPGEISGRPLDLVSFAIDASDRIFALDRAAQRICAFDRAGKLLDTFNVAPELDALDREDLIFGSLSHIDGKLYLPLPALGKVQIYQCDGRLFSSLGHKGNNIGELSFPVAVAQGPDGMILVLDKHRFNVLGFDERGRFLGEFGGKGQSPGWFYHPSLLAVDEKDQVYIGQLFENKVQVCRVPDFMTMGNSTNGRTGESLETASLAGGMSLDFSHKGDSRQFSTTAESRYFDQLSFSLKTFASSFGG